MQWVVLSESRILKLSAEHFDLELGRAHDCFTIKMKYRNLGIERMGGKIGRSRARMFIEEVQV